MARVQCAIRKPVFPMPPRFSVAAMSRVIVAILLSFLVARPAAADVTLSAAEAAFVRKAGPVTMCVDPDWAPF